MATAVMARDCRRADSARRNVGHYAYQLFAEMTILWGHFFILTNIDSIDYLSLALVKYGIHEKAVMNFLSGKPALIEKLLFRRRSLAPQQRIAMREAPEAGDDVAMDVRVTGCVSAKLSVKF